MTSWTFKTAKGRLWHSGAIGYSVVGLCPGMVAPTDGELDHLFTRRDPPRARHDHRGLSDPRMCPQHLVYGQSTQYAAG
jgi:hypothetical protein